MDLIRRAPQTPTFGTTRLAPIFVSLFVIVSFLLPSIGSHAATGTEQHQPIQRNGDLHEGSLQRPNARMHPAQGLYAPAPAAAAGVHGAFSLSIEQQQQQPQSVSRPMRPHHHGLPAAAATQPALPAARGLLRSLQHKTHSVEASSPAGLLFRMLRSHAEAQRLAAGPLHHVGQQQHHVGQQQQGQPPVARAKRKKRQQSGKEAVAVADAAGAADGGASGDTFSHAQQQRDDPSEREPPSSSGSVAALNLSFPEAVAAAELLFLHLLPEPPAVADGAEAGAAPFPLSSSTSSAAAASASHRTVTARPLLPELGRSPDATLLLSLLRRIWQAHSSTPGTAKFHPDHCSQPGGAKLLQAAADAARALGHASCSDASLAGTAVASLAFLPNASLAATAAGSSSSSGSQQRRSVRDSALGGRRRGGGDGAAGGGASAPGMPFVALRRAALLVLQLVHWHAEQQSVAAGSTARGACRDMLNKAAPELLLSFASAFSCSRASRPAMEFFHISKTGGTSMCQLAAAVGLKNPAFNLHGNCLIPYSGKFHDEPKWTRVEPFMQTLPPPKGRQRRPSFWPAVNCTTWVQEPERSCAYRAKKLQQMGVNFYANELTLHDGEPGTLGSAVPCPQLETVTVLREPVERARSHIVEADKVYDKFLSYGAGFKRSRNLSDWQVWAPAVLDNYMTRSMLGRQYMCRDFGALGEPELLAAARTLTSIDHVLLLEEGNLDEVVMRAGMGWTSSFRSRRARWAVDRDLHHDLGFPPDAMESLEQWNQLDRGLYVWGRLLLRLDAAFHSAVAELTGRLNGASCKPVIAPKAALGVPASQRSPVKRRHGRGLLEGAAEEGKPTRGSSRGTAAEVVAQLDGGGGSSGSGSSSSSGSNSSSGSSMQRTKGYLFFKDDGEGGRGGGARGDLEFSPLLLPAGLQVSAEAVQPGSGFARLEAIVRSSAPFAKIGNTIWKKLDREQKGTVPMLKLTLAMPILFDKFQAKLFSKLDVSIGKPSLPQTVAALRDSDKDKDGAISRKEFDDVLMCMAKIAGYNLYVSGRYMYETAALIGIIAMLCLTVVIVVNAAVTIQLVLSFVPTFGILVPSLALVTPALLLGPPLGAAAIYFIRHANQPRNLAAAEAEDSGDEEEKEEQLPRPAFATILKCKVELQKAKFAERRDKIKALFSGSTVADTEVGSLYDQMSKDSVNVLDESLLDEMVGAPSLTAGVEAAGKGAAVPAAGSGASKPKFKRPLLQLVEHIKETRKGAAATSTSGTSAATAPSAASASLAASAAAASGDSPARNQALPEKLAEAGGGPARNVLETLASKMKEGSTAAAAAAADMAASFSHGVKQATATATTPRDKQVVEVVLKAGAGAEEAPKEKVGFGPFKGPVAQMIQKAKNGAGAGAPAPLC